MNRAVLVLVLVFFVLFAAAALAYPGGTHFDHAAPGHDFWRNTMCDVARGVALDGRPNELGAALARLAMTSLALAVGLFFWSLPGVLPSRGRLGAAVRSLGGLSLFGMLAVVLLPTDRFSQLHGLAIVTAGVPGIAAAVVGVVALGVERSAPRRLFVVGVVAVVVAAACFGIYVDELVRDGAPRVLVPVLERAATILLTSWMLTVAHHRRRAVQRLNGSTICAKNVRGTGSFESPIRSGPSGRFGAP